VADYYEILGVTRNADIKQIKLMYRLKARELHPDKGGDPEAFKKLAEAYRVLSNAKLRARHDKGEDPLQQERTVLQQAMGRIATLFAQHIEQCRLDQDIIDLMKRSVSNGIKQLDNDIDKARNKRLKIEAMGERMKFDGDGENVFAGALDKAIRDVDRQLDGLTNEMAVIKQASSILEHYKYMTAEQQNQVLLGQYTSHILGGTTYYSP